MYVHYSECVHLTEYEKKSCMSHERVPPGACVQLMLHLRRILSVW